jgi:hypothetical protein
MNARGTVPVATLIAAIVFLAACSPATDGADELPDWRGVWFAEALEPDISGFVPGFGLDRFKLLTADAPWNANGRAKLEATLAGWGPAKGLGWGYPMMMNGSAPLEFVIGPEQTLIFNSYQDIRRVYTDGRELPAVAERWPTTWGDSIGRWEGDTLVIETVAVRHPPRYFPFSPPLSEQARYIERIRKVGSDRIESQMTIEDPDTLERAWVLNLSYTRAKGLDRLVHDGFDNDRSEVVDGLFTIAPVRK